jgi:hypothetical protein
MRATRSWPWAWARASRSCWFSARSRLMRSCASVSRCRSEWSLARVTCRGRRPRHRGGAAVAGCVGAVLVGCRCRSVRPARPATSATVTGSPASAISVSVCWARSRVCWWRRRACSARWWGRSAGTGILGSRAGAGASGVAAGARGGQTVDDREEVPLDRAVHLGEPLVAVLVGFGDEGVGLLEPAAVLGQKIGGGDEDRAGQQALANSHSCCGWESVGVQANVALARFS